MINDQEIVARDSGTELQPSGSDRARHRQLASMAVNIKKYVALSEQRLRSSVKYAMLAGRELTKAKESAGHGHWLNWFRGAGFEFGESMAQRYMRIYNHWPELKRRMAEKGNPSDLGSMTLTDSLKLLNKGWKADQEEVTPIERSRRSDLAGSPKLVISEAAQLRRRESSPSGDPPNGGGGPMVGQLVEPVTASLPMARSLPDAQQAAADLDVLDFQLQALAAWVPKRDKYLIRGMAAAIKRLRQQLRKRSRTDPT